MCKKLVICLALIMASVSFGNTVIGSWEGVADGWTTNGGSVFTYSNDSRVVTEGSQALASWAGDGWQMATHRWYDNATAYSMGFQNGGTITIDVSMLAEDWVLGSALDTAGNETHWGMKPLENIIIQNDGVGWWLQLSPVVVPDYGNGPQGLGVWKPENGDKQFTYTFTIPTMTFTSGMDIWLIQNRGGVDVAGPVYYDNAVWIPEPATIAMLGLGGLALIRRKK